MTKQYVGAYVLDAPYPIDREYAYFLPIPLLGEVRVGSVVAVPFGTANRRSYALVTSLSEHSDMDKVKPVLAVLPDRFSLTEEMRGLCFFLKEYTLCTVGDAVRSLLPSAAFSDIHETFSLGTVAPEGEEEGRVAAVFSGETALARETLRERTGCTATLLSAMTERGVLRRDYTLSREAVKTEKYLSLAATEEEILSLLSPDGGRQRIRGEAQEKILRTLLAVGRMRRTVLCDLTHTTAAQVGALVRRGLLAEEEEEVQRDPYAAIPRGSDTGEIALSRAQGAAYETLASLYAEHTARAALLYGVTGSGKTKVMMKLMDRVLADGRQVMLMVPEISLTPQTVSLFFARYGDRVAVIHSLLGEGERFDTWRRIAAGEVDVVIGTRSAVFAPLSRLGLIVMDEEHEHTYKSESDPKYHARDVAAYRCGVHGALLCLASATPSVESFYKAKIGKYTLVPLRERYGGATLPQVEVVDMREELRGGNPSPISGRLLSLLEEQKKTGQQTILFLNRRGYRTSVLCKNCGEVLSCPHCSVALTYHTDRTGGSMFCHICGYRTSPARTCSSCGSDMLSYVGFGTQKAEDDIASLFPDLRIVRMDLDTTRGKFSHEELLQKFRSGEADVLLGTQMVTKGHDFPRVATVGVLNADGALLIDDYRANERTFALLTQVIGRAGRGEIPGQAIIQTWNPDSEVLHLAARQDYRKFYEGEIRLRKALCFPPFCDIAVLTVSGYDEGFLNRIMVRLRDMLLSYIADEFRDVPLVLYGPFEAPVYRVQNVYRMRFVLKCRLNKRTRAFFDRLLVEFGKPSSALLREDTGNDERAASWKDRQVHLSVDLNPTSI